MAQELGDNTTKTFAFMVQYRSGAGTPIVKLYGQALPDGPPFLKEVDKDIELNGIDLIWTTAFPMGR